jgi:two-component system, sensor histidine kinase and response regulator
MQETEAPVTDDTPPAPIDPSNPVMAQNLPPAVDTEMVKKLMGALDADTIEMLGMFISMTQPQIAKIRTAFAQGEMGQLKELGHSLKGAARSACCMRLGDLAGKLQDLAADGRGVEESLIAGIEAEFTRAAQTIAAMKDQN